MVVDKSCWDCKTGGIGLGACTDTRWQRQCSTEHCRVARNRSVSRSQAGAYKLDSGADCFWQRSGCSEKDDLAVLPKGELV